MDQGNDISPKKLCIYHIEMLIIIRIQRQQIKPQCTQVPIQRMAKIRKSQYKCWGECRDTVTLVYCWWGYKQLCCLRDCLTVPQKVKSSLEFKIPLLGDFHFKKKWKQSLRKWLPRVKTGFPPPTPCKMQLIQVMVRWEGETGGLLGAHEPASLPCGKAAGQTNVGRQLRANSQGCALTTTPVPYTQALTSPIYTNAYTCAHTKKSENAFTQSIRHDVHSSTTRSSWTKGAIKYPSADELK